MEREDDDVCERGEVEWGGGEVGRAWNLIWGADRERYSPDCLFFSGRRPQSIAALLLPSVAGAVLVPRVAPAGAASANCFPQPFLSFRLIVPLC